MHSSFTMRPMPVHPVPANFPKCRLIIWTVAVATAIAAICMFSTDFFSKTLSIHDFRTPQKVSDGCHSSSLSLSPSGIFFYMLLLPHPCLLVCTSFLYEVLQLRSADQGWSTLTEHKPWTIDSRINTL
jgi:hypothetical protein